ncbi:MAG: hypothetical protein AAF514_09105, partial [Verrucomicrobiota bacterium]
ISFVDFPPTILKLAGMEELPSYFQGIPFLGTGPGEKRSFVYGFRERVDEVFEKARSVRGPRFLYIRNYQPHTSWHAPSVFSDLGAIRQHLDTYNLNHAATLTDAQRGYLGPGKSVEELYDTDNDPHQVNNLLTSGEPEGEAGRALAELRTALVAERTRLRDAGALPESELWKWVRNEGKSLAEITAGRTSHQPDLKAAWVAADLVGRGTVDDFRQNLKAHDPAIRFWAIRGLRHLGKENPDLMGMAADHLEDVSPSVRIETAGWLGRGDQHREAALARLALDLKHPDWWTALQACRAIELLGKKAKPLLPAMEEVHWKHRYEAGDQHLFLAFSSGAFLENMGKKIDPWVFTPGTDRFSKNPPPKN